MGFLWAGCAGGVIGLVLSYGNGVMLDDLPMNMASLYLLPWARVGPYLIGIGSGYLLFKFRRNGTKIHWALVGLGWAVSVALALSCVYGLSDFYLYKTTPSEVVNVFYHGFVR